MKRNKDFYIIISLIVALFSVCGCGSKEEIIGKSQMAEILSELYLADQILEEGTPLRVQADSMLVYLPIIEKHGYTLKEYKNSIHHYLQDEDTYKQLHIRARNILSKRGDEIRQEIKDNRKKGEDIICKDWWARREVISMPLSKLVEEPFVRAFKWIAMNHIKIKWNILDTTVVDVPSNAIWWENNLSPKGLKFGDRIKQSFSTEEPAELENPAKETKVTRIQGYDFKPISSRSKRKVEKEIDRNLTKTDLKEREK